MTNININKIYNYNTSIDGVKSISFYGIKNKVYSAIKTENIYGTFISDVIIPSKYFVKWYEATWEESKNNFMDVVFFVRTSESLEDINNTMWSGPYFNGLANFESYKGYLQFCIIIRKNLYVPLNTPKVSNIKIKYFTSENPIVFYTKTFNIGFTPKNALLTYNANLPNDAIVRFLISGVDSIDSKYYQLIEPNKIVSLDSISYLSKDIKIMMELIGSSQSNISVHEFAIMFSGDGANRVNKYEYISSSSEGYSSSSSEGYSSSSSTSSSSSEGHSSSSSTSSSSSESFAGCPNNISELIDTSVRNDIEFTFSKFINVDVNSNALSNEYISMFSGDISGQTYDTTKTLWGDEDTTSTMVSNGYVSLIVNGIIYYTPKYLGSSGTGCRSVLHGTDTDAGIFTFIGAALINVNNTERLYMPLYSMG